MLCMMVASGCKWLLVVARGCIYTHNLGFRSAQSLHIAYAYMFAFVYGWTLMCCHMDVAFVLNDCALM